MDIIAPNKSEIKVYLPENLAHDLLTDDAKYFVHLLYRQRIYDKRKRHDDFVNLKMDYLRKQLAYNTAHLTVQALVQRKIVETDGEWHKGYKATGYRLASKYRYATHREHHLTSKPLLKRLNNWWHQEYADLTDHHHQLFNMLQAISIDHEAAIACAEEEYATTIAMWKGKTGKAYKHRRCP